MTETVTCPCCKLGKHTCEMNSGTPESGVSGPPENYDPGESPYVEKITESTCSCLEYEYTTCSAKGTESRTGVPGLEDQINDLACEKFCQELSWDDDPLGGDSPDD